MASAEGSLPDVDKFGTGLRYNKDGTFAAVVYDAGALDLLDEFERLGLFVDGHLWAEAALEFIRRRMGDGFAARVECYHTVWPYGDNMLSVSASEHRGATPDELRKAHVTPIKRSYEYF